MSLKNNKLTILYTTLASKIDAIAIANKIIETQFGACINIIENVTSVYKWKGDIQTSSEVIMIVKTLKKHSNHIAELIKKQHSYSTSCIISFDCNSHNQEYNNWIMGLIKK